MYVDYVLIQEYAHICFWPVSFLIFFSETAHSDSYPATSSQWRLVQSSARSNGLRPAAQLWIWKPPIPVSIPTADELPKLFRNNHNHNNNNNNNYYNHYYHYNNHNDADAQEKTEKEETNAFDLWKFGPWSPHWWNLASRTSKQTTRTAIKYQEVSF